MKYTFPGFAWVQLKFGLFKPHELLFVNAGNPRVVLFQSSTSTNGVPFLEHNIGGSCFASGILWNKICVLSLE